MKLYDWITVIRIENWAKNVFVLPGVFLAFVLDHDPLNPGRILIGLLAVCFMASANYVINEYLDAPYDAVHPVKKNRPFAAGRLKTPDAFILYTVCLALGFLLAVKISPLFVRTGIVFVLMGLFYNLPPVRLKDRAYLDVLSEAVNNPIRLLFGWNLVVDQVWPPGSLWVGYWMAGAFLMAIKRFAELRHISDASVAARYRKSFGVYTETTLLLSIFFYAVVSAFLLGVFLVKFRIELLLALPFWAVLFTWYFKMGFEPDSPVQNPELMFKQTSFFIFFLFVVALTGILFFVNIPQLDIFLYKPFSS